MADTATPLITETTPSPTSSPPISLTPSVSLSPETANASAETAPPASDTGQTDDTPQERSDQASDALPGTAQPVENADATALQGLIADFSQFSTSIYTVQTSIEYSIKDLRSNALQTMNQNFFVLLGSQVFLFLVILYVLISSLRKQQMRRAEMDQLHAEDHQRLGKHMQDKVQSLQDQYRSIANQLNRLSADIHAIAAVQSAAMKPRADSIDDAAETQRPPVMRAATPPAVSVSTVQDAVNTVLQDSQRNQGYFYAHVANEANAPHLLKLELRDVRTWDAIPPHLIQTQSFGSPYLGFKQGRSLFVFPNVITLESAKSPEKMFEEFNTYSAITAVIRPAEYLWSDDENSWVFVAKGLLQQNTPNNEGSDVS